MKAAPASGRKILILAGGTGGHVYPALAVAEYLRAQGQRVVWLGTRHGLEAALVPKAGFELRFVDISGLRGKGGWVWLKAPWRILVAVAQSLRVMLRERPQVVLGMGGFVAGPGGIAAWLLHRPLLIHEQNAVPGLTNRLLGHLARGVMEAFAGSFPARFRAHHTGNPVRPQIAALAAPEPRLAGRNGPLHLLVLGGSQGARTLNEMVPAALAQLKNPALVQVRHQVGPRHLAFTQDCYARANVEAELVPYIDDMAEAYRWADLVLGRAGAMSIAELAAAGVASILVPYPYAVDDHQTVNGRYLAERGAAILVPQIRLDAPFLSRLLAELATTRERLTEMAVAARRLGVPDATQRVANFCMEIAHG